MKQMEFEVKEKERMISWMDGTKDTFRNITKVNAKGGDWLRFNCDEGYVMCNPDNIKFIVVGNKEEVR